MVCAGVLMSHLLEDETPLPPWTQEVMSCPLTVKLTGACSTSALACHIEHSACIKSEQLSLQLTGCLNCTEDELPWIQKDAEGNELPADLEADKLTELQHIVLVYACCSNVLVYEGADVVTLCLCRG